MTEINNDNPFGEKLDPTRSHRINGTYEGTRQVVRLTNRPSSILPNEDLQVRLPTLGSDDVIVPGSIYLTFDLTISKGAKPVNNIARNIVDRITITLDGNEIININEADLFYNYIEQWESEPIKTSKCYTNGIIVESENSEAVQSVRLGHTTKTDATAIAGIYGKKFAIPLDFELFKTVLPFNGKSLASKLIYNFHFVQVDKFLNVTYDADDDASEKSEKNSKATYSVDNIELQFTKIISSQLSSQVKSAFSSSFSLLYDRVHHMKTFPVKSNDQIWNWTFATPVRSLRGILLIGKKDTSITPFNYKVDDYWNMDIERINITIEGVNNILYDKGVRQSDIFNEATLFWSGAYKQPADVDRMTKELKLSSLGCKEFYDDKYCIWLDLRCVEDNHLHGSGMSLQSNSEGITLAITRKTNTGTEYNAKVYAFLMMDAASEIDNNEYNGVHW